LTSADLRPIAAATATHRSYTPQSLVVFAIIVVIGYLFIVRRRDRGGDRNDNNTGGGGLFGWGPRKSGGPANDTAQRRPADPNRWERRPATETRPSPPASKPPPPKPQSPPDPPTASPPAGPPAA